ncbi:hypothetical protein Tdes44962_MAKER02032 [Teratosphaeria destructans]|uniref:Uncharacterized protein n=1 Tax=Teratosphaeria destructans TaxID=418781 RepID=A0A9W7W4P9_9PEZI|nr:hypothetical protein Tdes44962_MAKER02032 [Teratosphaeria destructans]
MAFKGFTLGLLIQTGLLSKLKEPISTIELEWTSLFAKDKGNQDHSMEAEYSPVQESGRRRRGRRSRRWHGRWQGRRGKWREGKAVVLEEN